MLGKKVETAGDGPVDGVFQRDEAHVAFAGSDLAEDLLEVAAGHEAGGRAEGVGGGKVRERAFRAEVGHGAALLQGAGSGHDLAPDGLDMRGRERAGIAFGKAGQKLGFPYRVVHSGIARLSLGLPNGKTELGALAQKFEELGVQRVYLHSQFGEAGYQGGLCHSVFLIFPECLP